MVFQKLITTITSENSEILESLLKEYVLLGWIVLGNPSANSIEFFFKKNSNVKIKLYSNGFMKSYIEMDNKKVKHGIYKVWFNNGQISEQKKFNQISYNYNHITILYKDGNIS